MDQISSLGDEGEEFFMGKRKKMKKDYVKNNGIR